MLIEIQEIHFQNGKNFHEKNFFILKNDMIKAMP